LYDILVIRNRSWMYNRLLLGSKGYIKVFLNGVVKFVSFTLGLLFLN